MITLTGVSKTFPSPSGDVHAVRDVSLTVAAGEIFGVIGHSGAGKSTLVRLINLLEVPTSGSVVVDGQDLTTASKRELNERRRKIGMIFQHFHLLPSRTVLGNVTFALRNSGLPKSARAAKATELIELVGLTHRIGAYPSALSGGEKQRVAIARALANDPGVLLCDEATSALDPQTTASILALLREVNEKLGITIVLITHEMSVIKEICDRVAVMEDGEVKELGDVFDVFASPQSDVAREFVSSTSSLGKVAELVAAGSPLVTPGENEALVRLQYSAGSASRPLLFEAATRHGVSANIGVGAIEIVAGRPLGNLVVTFQGDPDDVDKTLAHLTANDVTVEVLAR